MKKVLIGISLFFMVMVGFCEDFGKDYLKIDDTRNQVEVLEKDLAILGKKSLEFEIFIKTNFSENDYIVKLKELNLIYEKVWYSIKDNRDLKGFSVGYICGFYELTDNKYNVFFYKKILNNLSEMERLSFGEHVEGFLDAVSDSADSAEEESHAPYPGNWVEAGIGAIAGGIGYVVGAIEAESANSRNSNSSSSNGGFSQPLNRNK